MLNDSSYSFTSDTALNGIGRFYLRFEGDALNIYETPLDALEIFTNQSNKTIVIDGQLETKTGFRLYDINGRMILNNSLNSASTKQVINVEHLTSGVYIIEITSNKNRKRVQKLVVN